MILLFIVAAVIAIGLTSGAVGLVQTMSASGSGSNPSVPNVPNTASSGSVQPNATGIVVSNSDQSLTGTYIGPDPSTYPGPTNQYPDAAVWNICTAVAIAEGFNQGAGVAPYDLNNPGDLSPGDEAGQPTAGAAQYHGGSYVIVFRTCEAGFIALYTKFANIRAGRSKVYPVTATWTQVAKLYAGNWQNWLTNVTNYLGVDINSRPADYSV